MSGASPRHFRRDFRTSRWIGVRVRPRGFEVDDEILDRLRGRVRSCTRIRKLFEDGGLSCSSTDGVRSDGGLLCETCDRRTACRPLLRVQLADSQQVYMLDLPYSSARNLIRLDDELAQTHKPLTDTDVVAEVVDRGHWGEVVFSVA